MEMGRKTAKRLANWLLIACCVVAAFGMALIVYVARMSGGLSAGDVAVALFAGFVVVAFGKAAGVILVRLAERDAR
jgi:hypothetical protein